MKLANGDGGFARCYVYMLLGELASSASTAGSYDGIQTANFTYNVVIINADNALNPNAKMCLIYTTIQKNTDIFQLRKFKTNFDRVHN
jgi:hypothetical protein